MAPARLQEEDPVTAEYEVYLTPRLQEQMYLLQYPNRDRKIPYNARSGAPPENLRIKPKTAFLELDVALNPEYNFNKYQSLKWADAMSTAKQAQNNTGTYGPAAGFAGPKLGRPARPTVMDKADRENQLLNDLCKFSDAKRDSRVMQTQTLGGQIIRHNVPEEAGKPIYFLGAFKSDQLHLTQVDGTVQLRPQFHHLDAEDTRSRLANARAATADGEPRNAPQSRGLQVTYKDQSDDREKDRPEQKMRKTLQAAEEEAWVSVEFVDEDTEEAYAAFEEKLIVRDVDGVSRLKSGMDNEQYLDAISAPRHGSPTRRRRAPRNKGVVDVDGEDAEMEAAEGGAEEDGQETHQLPR